MYPKPLAGLLLLALSAACAPGRQPVASVPAPASAPAAPVAVEPVMPVEEGAELRGAPSAVGADLLGTAQYDLPVVANEWVRSELEFLVYQRHEVVAGWLRAADPYDEWVRDVFASYGIPRDLHHLGMIESGYRPTVRSHAGAVGMWQFMPATGRGMGLRIDTLVDERMDPIRATHAAARHLRDLNRRFRGDWSLTAAAYNAGEGRINRAMGRFGATDFWDVAQRGDLAMETRRYVPRLYAMAIIAKDPQRFGYPATSGGRRFAYDSMRVDLATPLSVLAQLGNLPASDLVELNPHLFRQIAPRNYWVWVPLGQGQPLQQAFTASDFRQRGGYATYRVRQGESLARLAELSGVPEDRIRALNLSSTLDALRPGDRLRLYADAVRVLDARPVERPASARRRPRVLGDPAPAEEASPSAARGETATAGRESASASRGSELAATRRSTESSAGARGESSSRPSTQSASSGRRGESSERAAPSERRSASGASVSRASSSSTREGGSSRGERAASSGTPRSGGPPSSTASGRTHTVEDGETLWGIARRFDTTVDAVREANGLDEDDHIQPGQTLRIPRAAGSSAASPAARAESESRTASGERRAPGESASTPRSSGSTSRPALSTVARTGGAGRTREHTVGEGETLWGIARRYETTVDRLRRANNLDEGDQIQPGQKLRIPES